MKPSGSQAQLEKQLNQFWNQNWESGLPALGACGEFDTRSCGHLANRAAPATYRNQALQGWPGKQGLSNPLAPA